MSLGAISRYSQDRISLVHIWYGMYMIGVERGSFWAMIRDLISCGCISLGQIWDFCGTTCCIRFTNFVVLIFSCFWFGNLVFEFRWNFRSFWKKNRYGCVVLSMSVFVFCYDMNYVKISWCGSLSSLEQRRETSYMRRVLCCFSFALSVSSKCSVFFFVSNVRV